MLVSAGASEKVEVQVREIEEGIPEIGEFIRRLLPFETAAVASSNN